MASDGGAALVYLLTSQVLKWHAEYKLNDKTRRPIFVWVSGPQGTENAFCEFTLGRPKVVERPR